MDNAEIMQQLYAPFPLDMHSIREGHRLSNGKRIQWFVYLDRAAIQRRLDELFPLDWSFHHVETHRTEHYATVTVAMTVHGCTRVFNGGQEPREKDGTVDQDTEKGAFTEAFRRVASLFGLGLYAYEGVKIVTDSYERGDWDRQRDLQAQARKQFEEWYHKQFGGGLHPAFAPQSSHPSASQMLDTRSSNGNSKKAQQASSSSDWNDAAAKRLIQQHGKETVQAALDIRERFGEWKGTVAQAEQAIVAFLASAPQAEPF